MTDSKRSVLSVRPKNQKDGLAYSPERDLAYIYLPMLREVVIAFDRDNWSEETVTWCEMHHITEADLGEAAVRLVEAHRLFVRDREVDTPADAFEKAGFNEVSEPLKALVFRRIGEVAMGGFFMALRDVTMQGEATPAQTDFLAMIAAGRAVANRLSGHRVNADPSLDAEEVLERLRAEVQEQQRIIEQMDAGKSRMTRQLVAAQEKAREAEQTLAGLAAARARLAAVRESGWFKRLWYVAKLAYFAYRKSL